MTEPPNLADALADAYSEACQQRQGCFGLSGEVFVAYWLERHTADQALTAPAADLLLACACAQQNEPAIAAFEARYFGKVKGQLAKENFEETVVDETLQRLRQLLFLPTDKRPAVIDQYAGRSKLGSWLRVVALRAALQQRREQKRAPLLNAALENLVAEGDDPELIFLKQHYRAEFGEAVKSAVAQLPAANKSLLRYYYLDQLTTAQIGKIYRLDRTSVARRIKKITRQLEEATREQMMAQLKLDRSQHESVMRLIQSQLRVSLAHLLASSDDDEWA